LINISKETGGDTLGIKKEETYWPVKYLGCHDLKLKLGVRNAILGLVR